MPIYDYICRSCENAFEEWVRKETDTPECPACQSKDLERQLSIPRMHTSGSHDKAMRAAAKRDSSQAKENAYTQQQYEANHDDH